MRAYHEINAFEEQLINNGALVVKFWLAITAAEQLKRFNERRDTPFKSFKITDDDWRNRERWADYEHAVCDMVERCSTSIAPWHLIAANDKPYARIQILKTICKALEQAD
jgi:AMP-polyphosphate phosphotransferase